MLQYTFIFDTVRTKMPYMFIIILFVFLSHPIKIYHHLSRSATSFLPHHLLSLPHSFLLPFALSCFTPPSFSLPYWSIKIRFTGFFFFFPFSPFFLLSPLCSMIWYTKSEVHLKVANLPFNLSHHRLLSTISQIAPSAHYKISFTGYFSPFLPPHFFFFALSPLYSMISHTESV